jgi:hypothetical protein
MSHISPAVIVGFALSLLSALVCVIWGLMRWNRVSGPDEPAEEIIKWVSDEEQKSERE